VLGLAMSPYYLLAKTVADVLIGGKGKVSYPAVCCRLSSSEQQD